MFLFPLWGDHSVAFVARVYVDLYTQNVDGRLLLAHWISGQLLPGSVCFSV